MNILILTGDLAQIGGIERYNQDLIHSLDKNNCQVKVIQRLKGGLIKKVVFAFNTIIYSLFSNPNYILCCHINFSPILYFLSLIKKIRFSVSIYGIEVIEKLPKLKLLSLKKADKILTISNYTQELIIKQNISLKSKIVIIKSCVNDRLYKKKKLKFTKKDLKLNNKKIIITLSRLSTFEEKGHDRVLKSLEILQHKFSDFVYIIVGGGTDNKVTKILSKNKNLKNKVIFTGAIKDEEKLDYLSLADVFILPSKNEGFAIVFLEALMAGLYVIAPDNYGCPEGLLNGELGILVNVDRHDLIADAILSVFLNKVSNHLKDKKTIISKTKQIYGIDRWDDDVKKLYDTIK